MLSRCCSLSRSGALPRNASALLQTERNIAVNCASRSYHLMPKTQITKRSSGLLRSPITALCLNTHSVRNLSEQSSAYAERIAQQIPAIPEPPAVPVTDLTDLAASGVEPAFATLGLGGWTPVGWVQNAMEYVHVTCDVPWWGTIMIGTIVVRTIIFPLVILAQRNAAKMSNNMPQMQVLQMKMTEARQSGNSIESARYAQEMMLFMKEKDLNPLKNMLVPLAQAPLFISFFMGLRQMANAPVESMRDGGLFWFTDLTMPDQFFLLPLITSATLYLTIEIGTDGAKLAAQNMQIMKYVLRAMPIVIFPFTMNFPGAILCYWACSNFISLLQVGVLKVPTVRDFFKIERTVVHAPDALPMKKKRFMEGFKDSWTNMKITKELAERERIDEIQFQRAGRGPLVKTYKFDPTKVQMPTVQSSTTVQSSAKKHSF